MYKEKEYLYARLKHDQWHLNKNLFVLAPEDLLCNTCHPRNPYEIVTGFDQF